MEILKKIDDMVKRRALFIAFFSKEVTKRGGSFPIVVGGEALEIYTQGGYTTGDIDIKSPKELSEQILCEWNFIKKGRVWFNKDLDIYIDWLGEGLEEGREAEERVNTIVIDEDFEIKVISIEDLIIDRLNAAKWWSDSDSLMWSKVLIEVKKRLDEKIDIAYLKKRGRAEGIEELLNDVLNKMGAYNAGI